MRNWQYRPAARSPHERYGASSQISEDSLIEYATGPALLSVHTPASLNVRNNGTLKVAYAALLKPTNYFTLAPMNRFHSTQSSRQTEHLGCAEPPRSTRAANAGPPDW